MRSADSHAHRLTAYGVGLGPAADIILEVERRSGPAVSDLLLVFTVEEARRLADNLLQSITDTETKPEQSKYPIPPADLAQHLYGFPYGEEST